MMLLSAMVTIPPKKHHRLSILYVLDYFILNDYSVLREQKKQMNLEFSLKKEGKMLREIGFKVCGHKICMIKAPNVCGICGSRYTIEGILEIHGENKSQCSICLRSFTSNYNVKRHIAQFHEEKKPKPFKCSLCDLSFGSRGGLKLHIDSVHEKKKSKYIESDEESDKESDKEKEEEFPKNRKRRAPAVRRAISAKKSKLVKSSSKKSTAKKSKYVESDSESEEESDKESEEEELEYVPKIGKRGPPAARSAIPTKKVAKKPQLGN